MSGNDDKSQAGAGPLRRLKSKAKNQLEETVAVPPSFDAMKSNKTPQSSSGVEVGHWSSVGDVKKPGGISADRLKGEVGVLGEELEATVLDDRVEGGAGVIETDDQVASFEEAATLCSGEAPGTWAGQRHQGATVAPDVGQLPARYTDEGILGEGGMGEVRRVVDRVLNRSVAMKLIKRELLQSGTGQTRFMHEAQVLAQLQHPNILPLYDCGTLDDGRPFFTMSEIRGRTLRDCIEQVHLASDERGWRPSDDGWNLHRLVDALHDVTRAIAYAHRRGVLHRDIKTDNVMVGLMGEVLVVDWGLAKSMGEFLSERDLSEVDGTIKLTGEIEERTNAILGTPLYLAPELARMQGAEHSAATEVYALGVILYEILVGELPMFNLHLLEVLMLIAEEGLPDIPIQKIDDSKADGGQGRRHISNRGAPLPAELVEICQRATAFKAEERFEDVRALAKALGAWLDGSQKRQQALELVAQADALSGRIAGLRQEAREKHRRAEAAAKRLPAWEMSNEKKALWALEDEASALATESALLEARQVQIYRASLAHKADLFEAHLALARYFRERHREAEAKGENLQAREFAMGLVEHLEALPSDSAESRELKAYLGGRARLTLRSEPTGALARMARFEEVDRRLVLGEPQLLGELPVIEVPLEIGSYVVSLSAPGYHEVSYPVFNQRNDHHDGRDPDGEVRPVKLLPQGTLKENDCYVPAGWCILGGDPHTPNSLPMQRVWVEGFVIRRFPVTHGEYITFLNDLVERDQVEEAMRHVPREQSAGDGQLGVMVYAFDERFSLPEEDDFARYPVTRIEWSSARAWAAWLAERTGKPWRLPMEFEWEKAARGVDGRSFPWGEHHDPAWSCMKDSHHGEVKMYPVDAFPLDESVYGVRGTAGNTRDWCLDRFRDEGPPLANGRLMAPTEEDLADTGFKSTRGGSYGNSASRARSADRDWWFPTRSYVGRGFRVAWSVEG